MPKNFFTTLSFPMHDVTKMYVLFIYYFYIYVRIPEMTKAIFTARQKYIKTQKTTKVKNKHIYIYQCVRHEIMIFIY